MADNLSRRARQKIARREAILQAARRVFLGGDFHRATIAAVAHEAGVSKGTVYLYFESKEALLAELLREGLRLLEAQLVAAYAEDEALTPDVRVARLAGAYLEFAQAQPDYIRLWVAFDGGLLEPAIPVELADDINRLSVRGIELIGRAVREGIEQKAFRRTDARQVAVALWSALSGALLVAGGEGRAGLVGSRLDALFRVTLEVFLRALRPGR